jgi:hypothetical protein
MYMCIYIIIYIEQNHNYNFPCVPFFEALGAVAVSRDRRSFGRGGAEGKVDILPWLMMVNDGE